MIAAFGIRGIGSFYYLAYATAAAAFVGAEQVWATAGFVVIVSVLAHGIAATPIMARLGSTAAPRAGRTSAPVVGSTVMPRPTSPLLPSRAAESPWRTEVPSWRAPR